MERAQEREDEAEEMDYSALLTGRISSAQLHALGPITGDRAYAIVKGRHDKKQEESDKAKEAKDARKLGPRKRGRPTLHWRQRAKAFSLIQSCS
ncbi:hypothetical protein AB1Y20_007313 [Prymnesium parvum]|uniref:Uncharacterized protein n=1 Tax=Prymnesium parvum TaxID=97485 RepID=A0AB34IUU4_PRYPA